MPAIQFENVSKKYQLGTRGSIRHALGRLLDQIRNGNREIEGRDYIWALKDVSFEVEKGVILGVIGPNGAGKTTALKLLAGITAPTLGNIKGEGRISALIQLGAGFHPDLTGRENIYLNGSILGLRRKEIEKKFESIVGFAELKDFIDTPVKRYSSGMYVRLGFAVAAHIDPDILLIDEVLAVGDASFQQKCWERVESLRKSGTTIILVSHNLWAIRELCSMVILLWGGQIYSLGKPIQITQEYEAKARRKLLSGKDKDIATLDPWLSTGKAKFENLILLDEHGNASNTFYAGKPMIIRARYEAFEKLRNVGFEIAVQRHDGVWCWVARTLHDGIVIESLKGSGYFEARIYPLQLLSGIYSLRVQITLNPPEIAYAQIWDNFHVISPIPNPSPAHGVFSPQINWSYEKHD
jgi:ABC-type polysaccharide/polyol phosphate transport system ATPase subunit